MEGSSGGNGGGGYDGHNPARQPQHVSLPGQQQQHVSLSLPGQQQQQDVMGGPLSIEEMQNKQFRQQLLGMTATGGNFPHNTLLGTGNWINNSVGGAGGLGAMGSGMAGMTPSNQVAARSMSGADSMMSNMSAFEDRAQMFSSPSAASGFQLQQAHQQQQQQQQSLASQFASMQPQPSSTILALQEQLHHLQQMQQQLQQQQQQQQQMHMMNTSQQGMSASSSFNNATAGLFSDNQLNQLQLQGQPALMASNTPFDASFSNSSQAQIQGSSSSNTATLNQIMGRIQPRGMASSSSHGGQQSSSMFSSAEVQTVSGTPAGLNQFPFLSDAAFLGKIPGQDFPFSSGHEITDNFAGLARLGDNLSSFNFSPNQSGLATTSAGMRLPAQVYPEGMLGSSPSSAAAAPAAMLDTSRQEMKVQASSPSAAKNEGPAVLKPLSAYNYFFTEERDRILHGDGRYGEETNDARKERLLSMHWSKDRKVRRPHRKTHGKISFTTLSRHIGQKWRELDDDEKNFYKAVAKADMARYKKEIAKRDRGESGDAAESNPPPKSSQDST